MMTGTAWPKTTREMHSILLASALALASFEARADTYPKSPDIDIEHYVFRLSLSDTSDEIRGEATVDARFLASVDTLALDLTGGSMVVSAVSEVGTSPSARAELQWNHEGDRLRIDLGRPTSRHERRRFTVAYRGTPATGLVIGDNKHGDRTFFSDNWPNKARHWLPTVDHPYDKATSEMIVTAPSHYQVISNGLLVEETDLGDGRRLTHWRQSVPISTWLYVVGVARFAVQYVDEFDGKSIQTWVYQQDREAGFYDFAVPTRDVLEFYSARVGPYAYEKLANVQSNSVGGGMEAATAILYGDKSVTGNRTVRWRNVIIHEVAHQWWGNAVTEADWDDVWLSEGFATYFTLLFREHAYGRDDFVEGLVESRERVFAFHADNPDYRIVHDNLDDMRQVTTRQTYQKGGWTLHMLRGLIGDDAFWSGIQDYYRRFRDANATTDDFKRAMEQASGRELTWFFDQWLYQGGNLELEGEWRWDRAANAVQLELVQAQDDRYRFRTPIHVELRFDDAPARREVVEIDAARNTFSIAAEEEPSELVLDPDVWVLMQARLHDAR